MITLEQIAPLDLRDNLFRFNLIQTTIMAILFRSNNIVILVIIRDRVLAIMSRAPFLKETKLVEEDPARN